MRGARRPASYLPLRGPERSVHAVRVAMKLQVRQRFFFFFVEFAWLEVA